VDTEIVVTDDFLAEHVVGRGLMTLADKERQDYLIEALREQTTHVKKACGGSACSSIVAAVQMLFKLDSYKYYLIG
jgi:hypothetical protein